MTQKRNIRTPYDGKTGALKAPLTNGRRHCRLLPVQKKETVLLLGRGVEQALFLAFAQRCIATFLYLFKNSINLGL